MKTIIVSGGTPPSKKLLTQEITPRSIIIAADGGANCLYKYKITPNYLLGDFDSIDPEALNYFNAENTQIEKYSPDKDSTDNQLACRKAIALGSSEIVFLGCLGGNRVDHLLGAIGILLECSSTNIKASIRDEHNTIFLLEKSAVINGKPGKKFSLQAYCDGVKDLCVSGSKFELKNYTLRLGDNLTIANEFIGNPVKIDFTSGKILVFLLVRQREEQQR